MRCPSCKKKVETVRVYSECWQLATVEGKSIVSYGSIEGFRGISSIECDECEADLTDEFKTW